VQKVYCPHCRKWLFRAAPGSRIEISCPRCSKVVTIEVEQVTVATVAAQGAA